MSGPPTASATSSAVLAARGIACTLGGRPVVHGVTLDLHAAPGGGWTALVGPNGAGKSTLMSLLAGLRAPDAGEVALGGRPIGHWSARERAQRLAWLAQQQQAEGELAVRDVVALGRLPRHGLFGAPDAEDAAAVDRALAETACESLAARRLNELSGGERQRVLLARALAVEAPVLLLDEPTTHLDAPHQRALLAGLAARARDGAVVLAALHDLTLALAAARVLVLAHGRIVADGAPGEPSLQRALVEVFEGAFTIERIAAEAGRPPRWVAVPRP